MGRWRGECSSYLFIFGVEEAYGSVEGGGGKAAIELGFERQWSFYYSWMQWAIFRQAMGSPRQRGGSEGSSENRSKHAFTMIRADSHRRDLLALPGDCNNQLFCKSLARRCVAM